MCFFVFCRQGQLNMCLCTFMFFYSYFMYMHNYSNCIVGCFLVDLCAFKQICAVVLCTWLSMVTNGLPVTGISSPCSSVNTDVDRKAWRQQQHSYFYVKPNTRHLGCCYISTLWICIYITHLPSLGQLLTCILAYILQWHAFICEGLMKCEIPLKRGM